MNIQVDIHCLNINNSTEQFFTFNLLHHPILTSPFSASFPFPFSFFLSFYERKFYFKQTKMHIIKTSQVTFSQGKIG